MRKYIAGAVIAALGFAALLAVSSGAGAAQGQTAGEQQFVVVYAPGASSDAARDAIAAADGKIVDENAKIGVATVSTRNGGFAADATAAPAIEGAAHNQVIGRVPRNSRGQRRGAEARSGAGRPRGGRRRARGPPRHAVRREEGGAARRPPVGHAADRRHRQGLLQAGAGQGRARRHHRHGRRRHPPGHRPELRREAEPQLHHRHPGGRERRRDRRAVRGRELRRPAERRRRRPRHARGVHDRLAGQQARHRGRGAQGDDRQPARRTGLGLLLPAGVGRRPHLRGRQRHRRREHELLRRSVAVQLHGQPGRLAGRPGGAGHDHHGHAAGAGLRVPPRRHARLRGRKRRHGLHEDDRRRIEPGLRVRARRGSRTTGRSRRRASRCRPRATTCSRSAAPASRSARRTTRTTATATSTSPPRAGTSTTRRTTPAT